MELSGQIHAPAALSRGKEAPVPILCEAGWTLVCLEAVAKKNKKLLSLLGIELRSSNR
jgi:hypothetical protein